MMCCDLCGSAAECLPKEIESKQFDICASCWRALADKLSGKGRVQTGVHKILEHELAEQEEYEETLI